MITIPLGKGNRQEQSKRVRATSPHSFHRQRMVSFEKILLSLLDIHLLPVPSCLFFPWKVLVPQQAPGYHEYQ